MKRPLASLCLQPARRTVAAVAVLLAAWPVGATEPVDFSKLVHSRFVHCAFYKKYDVDPVNGDPIMVEGRGNALMHFQGMNEAQEQAFAIYTRMAGRRDVLMRHTAKAVHFIDNVGGMYLLTTVHNCLDYDARHGVCLTYGATHARVFDAAVVRDPDAVYEKIKASAEPGFCDHSFLGIQEAATSH